MSPRSGWRGEGLCDEEKHASIHENLTAGREPLTPYKPAIAKTNGGKSSFTHTSTHTQAHIHTTHSSAESLQVNVQRTGPTTRLSLPPVSGGPGTSSARTGTTHNNHRHNHVTTEGTSTVFIASALKLEAVSKNWTCPICALAQARIREHTGHVAQQDLHSNQRERTCYTCPSEGCHRCYNT